MAEQIQRKSLFILPHNPNRGWEEDRYFVFTEALKPKQEETDQPPSLYEKIVTLLNTRMTKAVGGDREDKIDAEGLWQVLIQFYNFKMKLSDEDLKKSGYRSHEDYELTRRNKAKHLMVHLGMIETTEQFLSNIGPTFCQEDIGTLEKIQVIKMHELSGYDKVILIDIICGSQYIAF